MSQTYLDKPYKKLELKDTQNNEVDAFNLSTATSVIVKITKNPSISGNYAPYIYLRINKPEIIKIIYTEEFDVPPGASPSDPRQYTRRKYSYVLDLSKVTSIYDIRMYGDDEGREEDRNYYFNGKWWWTYLQPYLNEDYKFKVSFVDNATSQEYTVALSGYINSISIYQVNHDNNSSFIPRRCNDDDNDLHLLKVDNGKIVQNTTGSVGNGSFPIYISNGQIIKSNYSISQLNKEYTQGKKYYDIGDNIDIKDVSNFDSEWVSNIPSINCKSIISGRLAKISTKQYFTVKVVAKNSVGDNCFHFQIPLVIPQETYNPISWIDYARLSPIDLNKFELFSANINLINKCSYALATTEDPSSEITNPFTELDFLTNVYSVKTGTYTSQHSNVDMSYILVDCKLIKPTTSWQWPGKYIYLRFAFDIELTGSYLRA